MPDRAIANRPGEDHRAGKGGQRVEGLVVGVLLRRIGSRRGELDSQRVDAPGEDVDEMRGAGSVDLGAGRGRDAAIAGAVDMGPR